MASVTNGRPRSFDEDQVLDKALEVFWRDGYASTSMQSLLTHMGISRQSLYNTFGDKRRLFLAALDRYIDQRADAMLGGLERADASYPDIVGFFEELRCSEGQPQDSRGCLIGKSCMELGGDDPEVAARIYRFFDRTINAFRNALDNAVAKGEIEPIATAATARHLTATLHGLGMLARGGLPPNDLTDVVGIALSVLPLRAGG
ncbi:MAG: TetR/AcrR family transcriptional regulator [Myxococcota bacterium]